ncbi:MAG: hypothetical protein LBP43_06145 [Treponema sp.]|nr:hypothetical protein [Treponema sp.]
MIIVELKKYVLIITDGQASTDKMAAYITEVLTDAHVVTLSAPNFSGADILPGEIYFFGCEKPHPPSFSCLATILQHINLAGRPCGIFSPNSQRAVKYLAGMVRDSELALYARPFLSGGPGDIKDWVAEVIGETTNLVGVV